MQEADMSARLKVPADLEQVIAAFLRGLIAADYSMRTIKASATDLEQFGSFLGERGVERVSAVTRSDVSDFAAALADPGSNGARPLPSRSSACPSSRGEEARKPYARSTIARKLSVVRSFLAFCEENGLL
jgi:site-specific recombinase XerD